MHHGGTFHQRDSLAQKCYKCQHFCVKKGLLNFFWPAESFLKVSFHYLYIIRQLSTEGIAWRKNVKNVNIFHLVQAFFWKFDRVGFYKKWISYIASLWPSIPTGQTFWRKNVDLSVRQRPDYEHVLSSYDVIGLSELHTNKIISIPGFYLKKQTNRNSETKNTKGRKSAVELLSSLNKTWPATLN